MRLSCMHAAVSQNTPLSPLVLGNDKLVTVQRYTVIVSGFAHRPCKVRVSTAVSKSQDNHYRVLGLGTGKCRQLPPQCNQKPAVLRVNNHRFEEAGYVNTHHDSPLK